MANYGDLFDKLAEAYARPSGAYRAASAAIDVPNQGIEGYLQGVQAGDAISKSKRGRRNIGDVLGQGLEGLSENEARDLAPVMTAYSAFLKSQKEATERPQKYQQGQFTVDGKLTRFDPITGQYETADSPGSRAVPISGKPLGETPNVITGTPNISPRVPPTVPNEGIDFNTRAKTLAETLRNVRSTFKPEYVGPAAGRIGAFQDKYISSQANPDRSLFRNRVAKAFNNLVYLRTGKQLNEDESTRMAEEFINRNSTPVAFMSALQSMDEEMNSLVANRNREYSKAGYRVGSNDTLPAQNADPLGLFK